MAEGVALAASIIAVVQITNSVISVCYDYGAAVKGASWQLSRIRTQLESLRSILQQLEPLAKQAELAPASADLRLQNLAQLCAPNGLLELCSTEVKKLEGKLKTPSWSDGFGPKRIAFVQALQWPLKESDSEKALMHIGRFTDTLNLALTADHVALSLEVQKLVQSTDAAISSPQHGLNSIQHTNLKTLKEIELARDVITGVDGRMEDIQLETKRKAIHKWLSATDPSTNYNRGCRSRQADTGTWFTNSQDFLDWKNSDRSTLWLHGKPGCGKSVLSSTIISEILEEHQPERRIGVAYFFFDFDDSEKQTPEQMVRCLIRQLSTISPGGFASLEALYADCTEPQRRADLDDLLRVLKVILCEALQVYIVIDAMDECTDIPELLSVLTKCQSWEVPHSHTLFTSRRLRRIEYNININNLIESQFRIDIQSELVNKDISTYVQNILLVDPGLQRWRQSPSVQEEIRSVLAGKADGMFRWAVCQLDTLRHCPNLATLRRALSTLPETLDGTYARILNNVPQAYCDYVITILRWLTFCMRPLKLREVAEVITINVEGEPWVDETLRFIDSKDLLSICSSLLEVDEAENEYGLNDSVIRLAHFSVKEYLVSQRIRTPLSARFWLEETLSHEIIAASCLAYLLKFSRKEDLGSNSRNYKYIPLFEYGRDHWVAHMRTANPQIISFKRLITEFLHPECEAYRIWLYAFAPEMDGLYEYPLYQMASHGVVCLVHLLLEQGADVNEGHKGLTALVGASRGGHEAVVKSLLQYGAHVDVLDNDSLTPLQVACSVGAIGTVYALLEAGASVNLRGNYNGLQPDTALQIAVDSRNLALVQLLTSRGADVNLRGSSQLSRFALPLGRDMLESMLRLLRVLPDTDLEEKHDAIVNRAPLQAACAVRRASRKIVEVLLENNADINAVGWRYGTAIQAACSYHGNFGIVRLLVEKGADIHIQAGKYISPLQAVSAESHDNVELAAFLIDKGISVNSQGGKYCTALQAACSKGNVRILKLLLENKADTKPIGGRYGSALHAAYAEHQAETIKVLLEAGADVNLKASGFDTALQVACRKNHARIVMTLLKNGADVNAPGRNHGKALKIALNLKSRYDNTHLVKLLLEYDARDDDLSKKELEELAFIKKLYEF